LFFDIALLKQQYAQVLNEQPIEKRPSLLLKQAAAGLETSRLMFSALGEMVSSSSLGYDVKHAKERANYCKDVKRVADKKIHETEVLEKQTEERLEAIRMQQRKREEEQKDKEVKTTS
jgi:RNA polymerase-associated protein CTR9